MGLFRIFGVGYVRALDGRRGMAIYHLMYRIGVLALQGAVTPHYPHIAALNEMGGAEPVEVRHAEDLAALDGLILPGGESSAMLRIMDYYHLREPIGAFVKSRPAWGICAGAILLADEVTNPAQFSFGALPIRVQRNAYGSQLDSFHAQVNGYDVAFIRAPVIETVGAGVNILAEHGGHPVWVEYGHTMATTFHPELSPDTPSPMHRRFLELCGA